MYLGIGGLLIAHHFVKMFEYNPYWIGLVVLTFLTYLGKRPLILISGILFIVFLLNWRDMYLINKADIMIPLIDITISLVFYLRDMYFLYRYKINAFWDKQHNIFDKEKFVFYFILVLLFCGTLILLNPNIKIL